MNVALIRVLFRSVAICFRHALLVSMLMGWSVAGLAQFPSSNSDRPFTNNSPFSGTNNSGGFTSTGGFGNGGFGNDTTSTDSLNGNLPEVKVDTRLLVPEAVFTHLPIRRSAEPDFASIYYWDQLDGVGGFVQSLGQTGKPYQVLNQGVEERFFQKDLWRDPIFDRYDRYVAGPGGIQYYDTHTPYVEVDFNQGPDGTTITHATLSQNINPYVNATFFIKRQVAEGAYRNFVTDHTTFWGSSNFSSKNRRYWLFGHFAINPHKNEINGGVPRDAESEFVLIDGVYQDQLTGYNASFFKSLSSPLLEEAQLIRNAHSVSIDQYYHLTGFRDTAQTHRLTLRGLLRGQIHNRSFFDEGIDTSSLNANLVAVYPTRARDSVYFFENFQSWDIQGKAEASYTWTPDTGFRVHVDGGIKYQVIQFNKDSTLANQNLSEQYANGEIRLPWLAINGRYWQRLSTRFAPANSISAGLKLYPLTRGGSSADTAASPLRLRGDISFQNLNPSLFQQYFYGDSGNVFLPNPDLQNQRLTHIQAGLELKGKAKIRAKDTLLPMYLGVSAFFHRTDRQIYYDSTFQVRQADAGEPMQWVGIALRGRLRMGGHFFLETDTRAQIGTVNSNDPSRQWLAQSIPLVHGSTKLYYDHRNVSWAEMARFGIQANYRTPYLGQAVDPWSGEFFPTNYEVYPFAWGEVFAGLRLRGVYIYGRYSYLNEGLFFAGYYSTPFYPMLRRALSFGVNWRFFN